MFLAVLGAGLMGQGPRRDPVEATARALAAMTDLADGAPLRYTAALADGQDLYAFRYAANDAPNSLYYQASATGVVVVSEPLDKDHGSWIAVPENHVVIARRERPVEVVSLADYGLGAGRARQPIRASA
jgi:glutamine amidotransferase